MADSKLSLLAALAGTAVDKVADLLYIADASVGATGSRNITPAELLISMTIGTARLGAADAAAPPALTIAMQSVLGGTSNVAGSVLTIAGSRSTGNATPGKIQFQLGKWDGASGTTQNGLYDAFRIESSLATVNRTNIVVPQYTNFITGGTFAFSNTGYTDCQIYAESGLLLVAGGRYGWSANSSTVFSGSPDTAMMRSAAGVAEVNTGTLGQFRDLKLRALTASGQSLTGAEATSLVDLSGTWNTSGTPSAIKLTITDTASNAVSQFLDLRLAANGVFGIRKSGLAISISGYATNSASEGSGNFGPTLTAGTFLDSPGLNMRTADRIMWTSGVNSLAGNDSGIVRNAAGVLAVTDGATTTNFRDIKVRNLISSDANGSYIQTPGMTVANLPASPVRGMRCYVTDSNAASYTAGIGAVVAAGGSTIVPVFYNGTNWLIG